mgnify:CR=1 FL=1
MFFTIEFHHFLTHNNVYIFVLTKFAKHFHIHLLISPFPTKWHIFDFKGDEIKSTRLKILCIFDNISYPALISGIL